MSQSLRPRVSICVPTLNSISFLPARFECVMEQSFRGWELLAYDSHSTDGTWEYLQELARRDPRIRCLRGPKEGPYPAWNACIAHTTGEYIYVATSDDTMAPDCLDKLVGALDAHSECDLSHCPLRLINEHGNPAPGPGWPELTVFEHEGCKLASKAHIRHAPYNGLLHLTGRHVFLSITQILIRRTLLEKTGPFASQWGPRSDFNWGMKAGLAGSMIHVPDTWATWRIHPNQLTLTRGFHSAERDQATEEMIADAFDTCASSLTSNPSFSNLINRTRRLRDYYGALNRLPGAWSRRWLQANAFFGRSNDLRVELLRAALGLPKWPKGAQDWIRGEFELRLRRQAITFP